MSKRNLIQRILWDELLVTMAARGKREEWLKENEILKDKSWQYAAIDLQYAWLCLKIEILILLT